MGVAVRLPPELRAKIAPLLRMQASSNDNERLNASSAIGRLLKNHGFDWHDLTAELIDPKPAAPEPQPAPGASTWKRSSGAIDLPRADLIALLDLVEERSGFLSLKSREFLTSLRERSWRPTIHLSEKQWKWMQSLLEELGV
jgi:hypothetical protein